MPRLFTALRISPEAALQLSYRRGGLDGARWIDPENYHITLSFVGDVDQFAAREIMRALDELVLVSPFDVRLERLDCFGGNRPRSLFLHAKSCLNSSLDEPQNTSPSPTSDPLLTLKSMSDGAMRRAGVDFDHRKFVPHLTLARTRNMGAPTLANYLTHARFDPVQFEVAEMVLLSSRDSRGGGPYRVEQRYEFGAAFGDLHEWIDDESAEPDMQVEDESWRAWR